jgi:beta-phosphoglucomutase family hydrolase
MPAHSAAARAETSRGLGLPGRTRAGLFDLDGVLTRTTDIHRAAWREMFDEFLAGADPDAARPFTEQDYLDYVDGKPRRDGVRDFLSSRGIRLPEGDPGDPPESGTIGGLANRKQDRLLELLDAEGVHVYDGSVDYVRAARAAGLATAVVTSSANSSAVLDAAGIGDLFDAQVDGVVAAREGLSGKPAPDTYVAAAARLGVEPADAAVFEDALVGVAAGRAGGFGYVVGVDRADQAEALRENGADVVVADLAELLDSA